MATYYFHWHWHVKQQILLIVTVRLLQLLGKIIAAYELTKAIQIKRPAQIVNLGSAQSKSFSKRRFYCCNQFVKSDIDSRDWDSPIMKRRQACLCFFNPVLQ
ncbi:MULTISPECIES: hypothetical protein [unclassified Flavobacterium]|uniref:hypothetical protein n=1 Tax=unclassified Flavobacterium TaxID=196869 RepID=UPI00105D5CBF|nr:MULTISPECIES: hypothetical protein [unclassified Flavobacterium]